MCGGVGFNIKNIKKAELDKFYPPKLVADFEKKGRAESFFWNKNPVLPVATKDGVQLMLWGNKDEDVHLPKTGWAKIESLNEHRWDYLHPEPVDIPVDSGYEKKVWFDLTGGTKGIVVKKDDTERVYMITKEADEEYQKETKHNREPLGIKKNFKHI